MTINHSSIQFNEKKCFSKAVIKQKVDQTFDKLNKIFDKNTVEELAWETGFIKRSSSRIRGFDFLTCLLISSIDASHTSLEKISDTLAHISRRTVVTAQAIMKRINSESAVGFFKAIYSKIMKEKLLELDEIPSSLLKPFNKVFLQDSSIVTLHEKLQASFKGSGGRASKASAKFDVIYDYKAKEYEEIKLTDQRDADQKLGLRIESVISKNSLIIRDLGYLRVDSLLQIVAKEAFFLSRLRSDILVYQNLEDKNPVDLGEYLAHHCKYGVLDQAVFITADKLQVRLIAYKAPEEVVNKRRRDAIATAKKQGRTLRESTLKFFDFTVFITNVDSEIWKAEVVGTIYRVRWQIELIFKCWKSRAHIHYLKGTNRERITCLIYTRLIYILLVHQIYRLAEFIERHCLGGMVSMPKVFEWMRDAGRLVSIMKGLIDKRGIDLFIKSVSRNMCMQSRNRKSTLERLCDSDSF